MDPRLLEHYERELRYFRESTAEFARAFPKIAGRLGIDGIEIADPYVERLIEATAFLSARVGVKLDAEFPRFTSQLLNVVYPHFLAPTPAMLIAQFDPKLENAGLALGYDVPRGTQVQSRAAVGQNTHCEFRTAHALKLWPLELTRAQYFTYAPDLPLARLGDERHIRGGLRITLRTTAGLNFEQLALDELTLHFSGDDDVAWRLHECVLGQPVGVLLVPPQQVAKAQVLPPTAITPCGFDDDQALLPATLQGFSGFRLLQEYFAFPARFQFATLKGLKAALARCGGNEVELVLLFSRADAGLEKLVSGQHVKLHCTPMINLFPKRMDRIMVSDAVSEFHLLADRTRPMDHEVHSVLEVKGYGAGTQAEQDFLPFYGAFHGARQSHPAYYTLAREPRMQSARQQENGHRTSYIGSEVYLSLVDPQQAPWRGSLRQLGVRAMCSNRDLPLLLPVGGEHDFDNAEGLPTRAIRHVRGPSRPVTPVAAQGLAWRAIDHLSLNYLSLVDSGAQEGAAALRELLALYAMRGDDAQQKLVQGLQGVDSKPVFRRLPLPGPIAFGRGLEIRLQIDEMAFHGHSAFLFGAVLTHFLSRHVSLNSFVETVLSGSRRGDIMRWRPTCGSRPIL